MREWIRYFLFGLANIFVFVQLTNLLKTYNPEPELLGAMILVNDHDGLSDWGLEQLDQLLDDAGYE